jgi:hypothetical protein
MNENNIFFVGKKRFEEYFIKPFNELIKDKKNQLPIQNLVRGNELLELDIEVIDTTPDISINPGSFDEKSSIIISKIINLILFKYDYVTSNKQILKNITVSFDNFKNAYKIKNTVDMPSKTRLFFYILPSKLGMKDNKQLEELYSIIYFAKKIVNPSSRKLIFENVPPDVSEDSKIRYTKNIEDFQREELKYNIQLFEYKDYNTAEKVYNWKPIKSLIENKIISKEDVISIFNKIQNEINQEFLENPEEIALKLLEKIRDVVEYDIVVNKIKSSGKTLIQIDKLNVFVSDLKSCQDAAGYFLSSFCDKIEKVIVLPCLHEIIGRAGEFSSRYDERTNCREEEKVENKDAMLSSEILDMHFGSRINMNQINMIKNTLKKMSLEDIGKNKSLRPYYTIAEKYKNYDRFEDCRLLKLEKSECTSRDKIAIDWRLYLDFYKYGYRDEIYWNQQFYSQKDRQFCRYNTFIGIFFNNSEYINSAYAYVDTSINRIPHTDDYHNIEEGGKRKKNKTKKNRTKQKNKSRKFKFSKRKIR